MENMTQLGIQGMKITVRDFLYGDEIGELYQDENNLNNYEIYLPENEYHTSVNLKFPEKYSDILRRNISWDNITSTAIIPILNLR